MSYLGSRSTVGFITRDFHALISRQHSQTNRHGLHTLFLTSKSRCMQKFSSVDALLTTQNVLSWSGRFGGGHTGWSQLQLASSVSPLWIYVSVNEKNILFDTGWWWLLIMWWRGLQHWITWTRTEPLSENITFLHIGWDLTKLWRILYWVLAHYDDVMMDLLSSQITSLVIVHSNVHSGADKRKHQSSATLWPVNSPHKWPVTRKMFPFDDVIMAYSPSCDILRTSSVVIQNKIASSKRNLGCASAMLSLDRDSKFKLCFFVVEDERKTKEAAVLMWI